VDWTHGEVVRALLHIDAGRLNTGVDIVERLSKKYTRHPHVRNLMGVMALAGQTQMMANEASPIQWMNDTGLDWLEAWGRKHLISPSPSFGKKFLIQHSWLSNGWCAHDGKGNLEAAIAKRENGWKTLSNAWPNGLPICLHTHLKGIILTVAGMPVDLGLPGNLDLKTIEKKGLLDL
jgi:hypothetical protein